MRTVIDLMGLLGASHPADVITGTLLNRSATPSVANAVTPTYFAYHGNDHVSVTDAESDALLAAGAALLTSHRLCPQGHPVEAAPGHSAQREGDLDYSDPSYMCFHCDETGREYLESETTPPTE